MQSKTEPRITREMFQARLAFLHEIQRRAGYRCAHRGSIVLEQNFRPAEEKTPLDKLLAFYQV